MRRSSETRLSDQTLSFELELEEDDLSMTLRERYEAYRRRLASEPADASGDIDSSIFERPADAGEARRAPTPAREKSPIDGV